MTQAVFAVDLGATWLRTALIERDCGRIMQKTRVATPDGADAAARLIEQNWFEAGRPDIVALATAPELTAEGVVRRWPNRRNYQGFSLLATSMRERAEIVWFDDATAAAISAHDADGDARMLPTVCMSIGSGIGGGVVIANQPLIGVRHAAMDVGHIPVPSAAGLRCACGRDGCVQAAASGWALRRLIGTGDLFSASDAAPALGRATSALADAVEILRRLLDPHRVVIAGGLGLSPLFESLAEELRQRSLPIVLERHRHGEDAALAGAVIGFARRHFGLPAEENLSCPRPSATASRPGHASMLTTSSG